MPLTSLWLGVAVAASLVGPRSAAAAAHDCGVTNEFVSAMSVSSDGAGRFAVHVTPTALARTQGPLGAATGSDTVTDRMWDALTTCVPHVHGAVENSLHQQLQCHVWLGLASGATGPTYDVESWRRPLRHPGLASYVATRCLNDVSAARRSFVDELRHTVAAWVSRAVTLLAW